MIICSRIQRPIEMWIAPLVIDYVPLLLNAQYSLVKYLYSTCKWLGKELYPNKIRCPRRLVALLQICGEYGWRFRTHFSNNLVSLHYLYKSNKLLRHDLSGILDNIAWINRNLTSHSFWSFVYILSNNEAASNFRIIQLHIYHYIIVYNWVATIDANYGWR